MHGTPVPDSGTIDASTMEHPVKKGTYITHAKGKPALTDYSTLQTFRPYSWMKFQIHTGRTHQIRVHMKHIGHPLFNDKLYGGDKIVKGTIFTKYKEFIDNCFKMLPHQALHAFSLGFQHPTKDEKIYLEAQMPDYFKATLEKWERYTEGRLSK